jgi:tRNA pseudouridine38-40 synthase
MQAAAHYLVGEHDFTSFRDAQCQAKTPVRIMHSAQVRRHGEFVVFDFRANAFLHHMVRNLVGALVFVGRGKHTPEGFKQLLCVRDRTLAAPTFSAAGLYLAGVEYERHWRLPDDGRIIVPFESPPH